MLKDQTQDCVCVSSHALGGCRACSTKKRRRVGSLITFCRGHAMPKAVTCPQSIQPRPCRMGQAIPQGVIAAIPGPWCKRHASTLPTWHHGVVGEFALGEFVLSRVRVYLVSSHACVRGYTSNQASVRGCSSKSIHHACARGCKSRYCSDLACCTLLLLQTLGRPTALSSSRVVGLT